MNLATDPRIRELLRGSTVWVDVEHLAEVTSTQDVALARLRDGGPPGLVVVADTQSRGRGRSGRPWRDAVAGPQGPANLAVSATLRAPERHVELVPLATGLAVADAYRALGVDPRLKWPNDVLLRDRKAAGILVERHTLASAPPVVLIGCGLNLDWRGVQRTGEALQWTSVAEALGGAVDRGQALRELLGQLAARLGQLRAAPQDLLAAYRRACATLGEHVRLERPGGGSLAGQAVAVDATGRLVIEAGGRRHPVDAGEVTHVRRS